MVYGMPPPPAPRKPPISGVDLGVSLTAMILTAGFGAFAVFIGMFMLVFLDQCPPARCSVEGGITAVGATLLIAAVIGVTGLTMTIIQLTRRKLAWPFAVGAFLLCILICAIGVYYYGEAVGADTGWMFG
ncbi:hypothetical protein BH10ACT9_BH10ACT9_60150 [soil metagenome]